MKISSKEISVKGPVGKLQAIVDEPEDVNPQFISVNCHPHSLHGGTMTNKVVHTLSRSIASLGVPSIRFNFRGVSGSEGQYDEGAGEQDDLIAVVDWMKNEYPEAKLLLCGFSFGSFVSASAANSICPKLLISVAPPVMRVNFQRIERPNCEWKVIMGTEDELVDYGAVEEWVKNYSPSPELIKMKGASHFFHGKLVELRAHIESIVSNVVENS